MEQMDIKDHYYKHWTGLIKPKGLDIDHKTLTNDYGKFYIRPLERGYGLTLGNAIRRVLLNSMMGSAISAVKFEGVVHEFTTLPGVLEDVTDIILNLKQVRFRQDNAEEHFLKIEKTEKGVVTAGDIKVTSDIEVLNPDQHIATLGEEARFSAEVLVTFDRGYIQADESNKKLPVGYIGVDAIHSPIRRVNYSVGSARVGQRTDYDSLVIEVWTDGSIKSIDAIPLGYKVLKEQLQVFINFDEHVEPVPKEEDEDQRQFNETLFRPVEDLELSVRSANCLKNAKIRIIGDLVTKSEQDMLKTKNFGRKSLNEIKDILKPMGLGLGMMIEGWPPKNLKITEPAPAAKPEYPSYPESSAPSAAAPSSVSSVESSAPSAAAPSSSVESSAPSAATPSSSVESVPSAATPSSVESAAPSAEAPSSVESAPVQDINIESNGDETSDTSKPEGENNQ